MTKLNNLVKYMATTYARPPITIAQGQGSKVWDTENKEYIDFTSGIAVTALGHSDPGVSEVIAEQAPRLMHCSNLFFNEWAPQLSADLVERTIASGGMSTAAQVFLCNSGSESNEAALKFARKRGLTLGGPAKHEVVAFNGGFHGRTFGALTATNNPKYQAPFAPMVPGFHYGSNNTEESLALVTDKTCAVIVEPIQGEGGIHPCDLDWLRALRAKCNETGATLIYDEIQCGLGRSGDLWAHAAAGQNAEPDIVTMAKALGNGFPIGATMISKEVNDVLKVGDHGTTYGGNPLGSRVGLYVLSQIDSEAVRMNVNARSQQITQRAQKWIKELGGTVTEVRGRGLLLGIQLSVDPAPVLAHCRDNGLLVITAGTNTLRLVPALTISEDDVAHGLDIMEDALKAL